MIVWFLASALLLRFGESVSIPLSVPGSSLTLTASPPHVTDVLVLRLVMLCGDRYEAVTGSAVKDLREVAVRWSGECQ